MAIRMSQFADKAGAKWPPCVILSRSTAGKVVMASLQS